jgi:hypothetical protein
MRAVWGRLLVQLLGGLPVIGVDTDARLQSAVDFADLAAVTCDLTERALPAVIDLLTAVVRRSGEDDPIIDRLCREPVPAGEVLSAPDRRLRPASGRGQGRLPEGLLSPR